MILQSALVFSVDFCTTSRISRWEVKKELIQTNLFLKSDRDALELEVIGKLRRRAKASPTVARFVVLNVAIPPSSKSAVLFLTSI